MVLAIYSFLTDFILIAAIKPLLVNLREFKKFDKN